MPEPHARPDDIHGLGTLLGDPKEWVQPAVCIFFSTAHPGEAYAGWVYARALVRPLAACVLPLMIATLAAVLQGYGVMSYLIWGFPAALLAASLWTGFNLRATIAEIHVQQDAAAVRTVWECIMPGGDLRWQPVLDLRKGRASFYVTLGQTSYELLDADWPTLPYLLLALQQARNAALVPPPS